MTLPWLSALALICQLSVQPRPNGPIVSRPEIEALNWRTKSSGIAPGTGNEASVTESSEPVVSGVVGRVDREAEQALDVVGVFAELAQVGGLAVEVARGSWLGRRAELGGQVGEDGGPGGVRDVRRLEARFQRRPVHRRAVAGQDLQAEIDRGALREGGRFVRDLDRALKAGRQRAGRPGVLDAEDLDARPREAGLARQPDRGVAARDRDDEQRRQGVGAAVVACR